MANPTFLPPLESQQPLVDATGKPSAYFLRYLKDRGGALTDLEALFLNRQVIAGDGLDGGGKLGDGDVTLTADVQEILDQLTTQHGAILFRGATGWEALAPGTAGEVLYTNGIGANPYWDAPAGGSTRQVAFQIVSNAPTTSELLFAWSPASGETVTFRDEFSGSTYKKASTGTNPSSTYTMTVKKNGSNVGTIVISTSGVVTFTTTGTTIPVIGGTDVIEVFAPATPDAGAVGYTFTLLGDL